MRTLSADLSFSYSLATLGQRKSDVLKNVHVRPNRVGLKHHADFALLGGNKYPRHGRIDHASADFDFSSVRPFQAGDASERGRLAATAGSQKNAEIALGNFQIDFFQRVDDPLLGVKSFAELSNANH